MAEAKPAEVKPGYKSTENYIILAVIVLGGLLESGVIGSGGQLADVIGAIMQIAAALGYTKKRTDLKVAAMANGNGK